MLTVPFLTELDSRAAVRGSLDPLGMMSIWTRFGRHVVGNLTTVTTSVRDFTVLLLGYYFAERLAEAGSDESTLHAFLKWEQLASYARAAVNKDLAFRGTERVQKRLSDGGKVVLSPEPAWATLGDQKNYGLWGLYTVASRSSSLLDDGTPPTLMPAAREFVEGHYLPLLGERDFRRGDGIVSLLAQTAPRLDPTGRDRPLLEAVARLLKLKLRAEERAFYREHLLLGGPDDSTRGLQRQLVTLLPSKVGGASFAWTPSVVGGLAGDARKRGKEWAALTQRLERIRACESVAAPASALFAYLLGADERPISQIAVHVSKAWKEGPAIDVEAVRDVSDEMGATLPDSSSRWLALATALSTAKYEAAIDLLIQQNASVMRDRGGSAWVEKSGGKLDVRFHEDEADLPSHSELKTLWRFPYFLDSLRTISLALREDA